MADEGFNIEVGANIEKARRDVARLREEITKPASVPVGAGGTSVGVAGAAPTAAGVLGASFVGGGGRAMGITPDLSTETGRRWAALLGSQHMATYYGASAASGGGQAAAVLGTPSIPARDVTLSARERNRTPMGQWAFGVGGGIDRGIPNGPWNFLPSYGGAGGAPGAFSNTVVGRGWGATIGVGYIAQSAFRGANAYRDYNVASGLAGSDQRAQVEATLALREGIMGMGGPVGQAVGFAQDPHGMGELGIRSTLGTAESMLASSEGMRNLREYVTGLRGQAGIAAAGGSVAKALLGTDEAYRETGLAIDKRRAEQGALNAKEMGSRRSALEADRVRRAMSNVGYWSTNDTLNAERDRIRARDEGELSASTDAKARALDKQIGDAREFNERKYRSDRGEILAAEGNRFLGVQNELLGSIEGSELRGANRPHAAARNALVRAGLGRYIQQVAEGRGIKEIAYGLRASAAAVSEFDAGFARESQYAGRDLQHDAAINATAAAGRAAVVDALLNRNPLGATVAGIEANRNSAIAGIGAARDRAFRNPLISNNPVLSKFADYVFDSARGYAESQAGREIRLARQQDTDQRALVMQALKNQGGQLDIALDGGIYGGVRANALAARDAAMLNVQRLEQENGSGANDAMILQTLTNADKELSLAKRNFFNQFRPSEIDINRTDLSGEGVDDVVKAIADMKKAIVDAIMAVVLTAQ